MDGYAALPAPPSLDDLLASAPHALFLDFDGTLIDLAPTPDTIRVPDTLPARLAELSARLGGRLALVSGRATRDLERHLGPITIARAGSHGAARLLADGSTLGDAPTALPAEIVPELKGFATLHDFAWEDKPHGAALHYRGRPELEETGLQFAGDFAARHGLQVKRGKCVIEIVRPGADKGAAVRAFMAVEPFEGAVPVFVGDDVTDEDGFAAVSALGGFGIAVGDRPSEGARFHISDVAEVHEWLAM